MSDINTNNEFTSARPYTMTDMELENFSKLIYKECGIALSPAKKSMLSARLAKRLRALSMGAFDEYYKFVKETIGKNDELISLIDVVTTNTTEFFRENNHFTYMEREALPNITRTERFQEEGVIRAWSAGCSTGEEPYTLAMVLSDYFERNHGDFRILATDISTKVLNKAKRAIYDAENTTKIPAYTRQKYMMRGKGEHAGQWRVVPELRQRVDFARLNFIEDDFGIDQKMDIIMCRNVVIYFDWETKAELTRRLYDQLLPGGYLFIGHSETLNGLNDDFVAVAPTIYRKPDGKQVTAKRYLAA